MSKVREALEYGVRLGKASGMDFLVMHCDAALREMDEAQPVGYVSAGGLSMLEKGEAACITPAPDEKWRFALYAARRERNE